MKRAVLIGILLIFDYSFSQENVGEIFDTANKFYIDEKYQEAVNEYVEILNTGYENGAIYFNLGNAYYKLGSIGKAILYYEKAKKIIPGDEDVNNNLTLANLYIADKITPVPELFYIRYFKSFTKLMSLDTWAKVFLALYIILCLTNCGRIIIKKQKVRNFLHKLIFLSAFLTALFLFIMLYSFYELNRHDWAIVMSDKVEVSSSPTEDSTELFSIHEGTKVKIKRTNDKWIEISLADGKVGWITKDHIEII